ncbi:MAG: hypothetical protein WA821_08100 [Anaerolineales bacterium]
MADTFFYEELIYQAIASSMGLEPTSLRLFPTISLLNQDDYWLFNTFDIIPNSAPPFEINETAPLLGNTYGALLQSQPTSFPVTIAKKNFENPAYWLPANTSLGLPKTPVYSPTSAGISNSIAGGASLDFELDSSKYPSPVDVLYPSFPSFVVNQPLRTFNQIAGEKPFVFTMHFDKVVSLPVRPGGWFSQAVFAQAYQSGGKNWGTGPGTVTWDDLFGENGILKFIYNGVLAISGIVLELQSFGQYDSAILDALNNAGATSIWPFYLNIKNMTQQYALNEDGSIEITSQVPSPDILLLAMQAESIDNLLGNTA